MENQDPIPLKSQLTQLVADMEEWQVRLVLSFATHLFGSKPPTPAKEAHKR